MERFALDIVVVACSYLVNDYNSVTDYCQHQLNQPDRFQ